MSSQDDKGISFNISNDLQNFRLLELPPALLELVTSENPPVVYLKSKRPNTVIPSAPAPAAVICTHDQTFEVRQVQSSNILYVAQPSSPSSSGENESLPLSNVTAVGQCKALLELVPVQTQPLEYLSNAILIYDENKQLSDCHRWGPETDSKQKLLIDAPFSTGEFNSAWTELCAFEFEDEAWRPTAVQLQKIWKYFMTATFLKEVDMTTTFQYDGEKFIVEEGCWDEAVLRSILRRLSLDHEHTIEGWVHIDRSKCVRWVGQVFLEAFCRVSRPASNFLEIWQDQLPESWREDAKLDLLSASFTALGDGSIVFKGRPSTVSKQDVQDPAALTSTKGKSKWHEKFQATRA